MVQALTLAKEEQKHKETDKIADALKVV